MATILILRYFRRSVGSAFTTICINNTTIHPVKDIWLKFIRRTR